MLFFKLAAFYFFYFSAVGVYVIFFPKILLDLGYSTLHIGIIFALAPLMKFITPFLFLKHINLNQKIFKITLFTTFFASSLFYITINNFYFFMLNNALLGTCLSIILPYLEVTSIKILGKNKYGKCRMFGSIGFALIALFLGKFLWQPFIALHYYLGLNIFTIFFALLLLKDDNELHEEKTYKEAFSFVRYWPFWISLFFMQLSFGAFYNFFTIYETQNGISLEMTSYLWSFGVFCEIILLYFQAPLLKNNLLNMIKFSIFITVIRWSLLFFFPNNLILTFITQGLHAISFGLFHSCVIIFLYSLYENKKLAQQFMYGVAYGLGGFLGAIIAGWVYGKYLFLYSAFFALLSLIFLYFLKIKDVKTIKI